jgi:D-tyrosyl-tRNA(Tyr) deacylase
VGGSMIAVLQRSKEAVVKVAGQTVGSIEQGLVILLGVFQDDQEADADFLVSKIVGMRVFNDANQKLNLSLKEVAGSALVVSQFTLCGDWCKGRRPSFIKAAAPARGNALYEYFIEKMKQAEIPVAAGIFGAMMEVSLVNDGPVTFVLDSRLK